MKLNKLFILLAVAQFVSAQTTTAKLEGVNADGLHRIFLEPEIRSYSEISLDDFRIYDKSHNQVPYQIPNGNYDGFSSKFIPYKIISREVVPNKKTSIVVENPKAETRDITLKIANAEVTKKFSISGSDDGKQWFGLVNQRELSEITNESSSDEFKIIFLPLNSYKFIRFDIDDKKTLPLNILAVGDVQISKHPHKTATVKPSKMTFEQDNERKLTRIHVQFDHAQFITHYKFNVIAPNHYNRNVRLYKNVPYRYKKKDGIRQEVLDNFTLSDQHNNTVYEYLYAKDFYFEIENRDNPALTIKDVLFSQNVQWIVADLKASESYTIETGDPKMAAPDYDMVISEGNLRDSMPEAKITEVEYAGAMNDEETSESSLWQKPWFLWTCIIIGALAVVYFTVSLVKDMKQSA